MHGKVEIGCLQLVAQFAVFRVLYFLRDAEGAKRGVREVDRSVARGRHGALVLLYRGLPAVGLLLAHFVLRAYWQIGKLCALAILERDGSHALGERALLVADGVFHVVG